LLTTSECTVRFHLAQTPRPPKNSFVLAVLWRNPFLGFLHLWGLPGIVRLIDEDGGREKAMGTTRGRGDGALDGLADGQDNLFLGSTF